MNTYGYNNKLYYRVEDLAEIADTTPRGDEHDAAVSRYVAALHAICGLRADAETEEQRARELRQAMAGVQAGTDAQQAA
ncbi:hypothetical protein ACFWU5_16495 [Nocardia sp. NPDC058640]|uniref:hypothetical protein n=1 Tax=Nocardia sp. NPDC058640 TaxID=3346571 RepID=UPI003657D941